MKATATLIKHYDIIMDALNDYGKWFDEDEDQAVSAEEAIADLKNTEL